MFKTEVSCHNMKIQKQKKFSCLRCRAKTDCTAWSWKSRDDTCSTITSATVTKVWDFDYVSGMRDCGGYLADHAWLTCSYLNPTTNLTSSKKTQLAIPDALNHPLQCIEACRGATDANSNAYTNAIYTKTPKECWCAKNMVLQQPYDSRDNCDLYEDYLQIFMVVH